MSDAGLAFDIGANTGQDTAAFLARGLRVVAVEANPKLCADMRQRYADEISDGRLVVVAKAISGRKTVTLHVNSAESAWGTTSASYAARSASLGGKLEEIEVETITMAELIKTYGVPGYLKIDIEGADILCLLGLFDVGDTPQFVSIERPKSIGEQRFAFDLLRRLGYTRFQIIDQSKVPEQRHPTLAFQSGSTGLYGAELPEGDWVGFARAWALNCWIVFRSGVCFESPAGGVSRSGAGGSIFTLQGRPDDRGQHRTDGQEVECGPWLFDHLAPPP